jgi:hypothetical protein
MLLGDVGLSERGFEAELAWGPRADRRAAQRRVQRLIRSAALAPFVGGPRAGISVEMSSPARLIAASTLAITFLGCESLPGTPTEASALCAEVAAIVCDADARCFGSERPRASCLTAQREACDDSLGTLVTDARLGYDPGACWRVPLVARGARAGMLDRARRSGRAPRGLPRLWTRRLGVHATSDRRPRPPRLVPRLRRRDRVSPARAHRWLAGGRVRDEERRRVLAPVGLRGGLVLQACPRAGSRACGASAGRGARTAGRARAIASARASSATASARTRPTIASRSRSTTPRSCSPPILRSS